MSMVPRLLLSAIAAWILAGLLSRGLGRLGWLDQPNARSSHVRATPRGGGVAFIVPAVLLAPSPMLLLPLPLALVGLLDDRRGLPVRLRLGVQLLTALALALQAGWSPPLALLLAVPATAVINAVNFMDGLDGLVAACLAIWLVLAAAVLPAPTLLLLAAGLLGFLAWNWSPARLFMGDVGSTYLGAVLAGGLLSAARSSAGGLDRGALLALGLAAMPLLGDAFSCLMRRLLAGQRLWQAHRLHLYQRLQQAGWSHSHVAGVYGGVTLVLALLGGTLRTGSARCFAVGGLISAALVLTLGWRLDRCQALSFDSALRSTSNP